MAALVRRLRSIDLAEECLAEAALRAQAAWGAAPPADASGWLYVTALRCGVDRLRRATRFPQEDVDALDLEAAAPPAETPDDRLALYFLCAHPALSTDAQIALMLRLVAGLPVAEIARAFLADAPTILQRITRAKAKVAAAGLPFEAPPKAQWAERLPPLLSALSIVYDQSYVDVGGGVEPEALGREATLLAETVAALSDHPEAHGLAATIRFCESRRPARIDRDGAMIPLDQQDPKLWRRADIDAAAEHLRRAARRRAPGPFQVMALIHAAHARRIAGEPAPTEEIAHLYDALLRLEPSPVVALNAALARAAAGASDDALVAVERLAEAHDLDDWQPYHAAHADLLRRAGRRAESQAAYARAIALAKGRAERLYLEARLRSLG
ncbi:MAG: hypothetical protein K2Q06_14085 [Parvularculaceae bacterium]|nr:hypothetical protein [Parvularculaceae bacterium]